MPTVASAIPVGTQFSPGVVDLAEFVKACVRLSGDKTAIEDAVWKAPVRTAAVGKAPTKRRKSLPVEAAVQYGLLEAKTYNATPLCRRLAKLSGTARTDAFARHILLNLGGLRVVEAAQQMALDGLGVTADTLARKLTEEGFVVTEHNTAINSLRMWLAEAKVFGDTRSTAWDVNAKRKAEVGGFSDAQIAALVNFTPDQRAFAIALCRIDPKGDHPAADVRRLAESITGRTLPRDSARTNFLEPLEAAGLITFTTGGTGGGKSALLRTTPLFNKDVLEPFVQVTVKTLDAALTAYYKKPIADTYAELGSTDKLIRGKALEAYAVHIMRLLGFRFLFWRKRARDNPAEIDVVMVGSLGGLPSRWQIQCKNFEGGGSVDLEDVAKEVGLLPLTDATHIMVLANGPFTRDARRYATEVVRNSPIFIYLLDKKDFERIKKAPGEVAEVLREKSAEILSLKRRSSMWEV